MTEELNLLGHWNVGMNDAYAKLRTRLAPILRLINQIPSSHGNNNEWVAVYKLDWQSEWGDPCDLGWKLSDEGNLPEWLSLEEIERRCLKQPMEINAALRLFLRRRDILVPLVNCGSMSK